MNKRRLYPSQEASVTALKCQMENHVSEMSERSQNTSDDSLRLMRRLRTHFKCRLGITDEKQYKCSECSHAGTVHGHIIHQKSTGGNKKPSKPLVPSKMHTSEKLRLSLIPGEFGDVDDSSDRDNNPIQSISGSEYDLLTTLAIVDTLNPALPSSNIQPGNESISGNDEEKCTIDEHGNIQKWRVCHLCTFAETSVSAYKQHMEDHVAEMPERNQRISHICHHGRRPLRRLRIHVDEKPYKCTLCPYASTDYGRLLHHNCSGGGNKKPLKPLIPSKTHNSEKLRPLRLPPGGSCNFGSNLKYPGAGTAISESVIDSQPVAFATLTPMDVASFELPSKNHQSEKENISRIEEEK